ncbi:MAG: ATP-binding protein [Oscillospiraceae bacterium]|nr:ATP-binding protein [Oscillospiraceae bacterium]
MMDGKLLARARDGLARRREENAALRAEREKRVYARVPEIRDADAALRALMGEVISAAASHAGPEALAEIERRSGELCRKKETLLAAHGFAPDYLDEIVSCPRCRDRGYLADGSMCACLEKRYEAERERELREAARLGDESFSDFDLGYYEGQARQYMELALAACRQFAVSFGPGAPNLLLQGGTGLGKTFLSRCVARVVSGRGFSVDYEPAQAAFAAFEAQKFSRDPETWERSSQQVEKMLNCDLLILDDLGTEMTTAFTQSALYNILNTRLSAGKKTIVSTNLSDTELAERYIPQTVSRLSGEFDTLTFKGRDIRAIRKERRYL